MADKKISDLTAASSLADGDLFEIENTGGNSRKITGAQLKSSAIAYEAGPAGTVPTVASLTWLNQGTSTASDGTGMLILKPQVNSQLHSLVKPVPSAPFDVYCRTKAIALSTATPTTPYSHFCGIALRNSANGNVLSFQIQTDRANVSEGYLAYVSITRWTSSGTTVSATPIQKFGIFPWQWVRVNVTSTTITFYASMDGKNWFQVATETISTFIGAVTDYGACAFSGTDATEVAAMFSYLSTTAPS